MYHNNEHVQDWREVFFVFAYCVFLNGDLASGSPHKAPRTVELSIGFRV